MLYHLKQLIGMSLEALDGDAGKISDVYFDNQQWTVRYLVIDTGGWLNSRKVLISPFTVDYINLDKGVVGVRLAKDRIEGSPHVDTHVPVSRQYETDLSRYYGYPEYWSGILLWGATPFPLMPVDDIQIGEASFVGDAQGAGDPHLHSVKDVTGYQLQASDDAIGHLEDFVIDEESWAIRYLIVDTSNWLPGKHVVISPQWIKQVNWEEKTVHVDVTSDAIKSAPEYDVAISLSRTHEENLYQHYERPKYW